jgi:glycoside/pentoside/hexuronide:cation symporter, GPH family
MQEHNNDKTAMKDRVSSSQKIGIGMGGLVWNIGISSLGTLANFIFNIGLGVSPILVGIAQSLPRVVDAMVEPFIGNMSDNTRSRFGRRLPYMAVGGLTMSIFFGLVWCFPRGWHEFMYFLYFMVISTLFYIASSIFTIPWQALSLELTADYHERTRVIAVYNFFGNIGTMAAPWLYALTQLHIFKDTIDGARYVGLTTAGLMLLCVIITLTICREPHLEIVQHQAKIAFWRSVSETCRNRIFLLLLTITCTIFFGFFMVSALGGYILIYYVYRGDTHPAAVLIGCTGTVWALTAALFAAPIAMVSTRLGKSKTMFLFMLCLIIGELLKIVCYNQTYPYLIIIPQIVMVGGMVATYVLSYSMLADICDLDELNTGLRREGSYSAVFGSIQKIIISISFLITGLIIKSTGFDESLNLQTQSTVFWLRFWDILIPIIASLAALAMIFKYPLTKDHVYEIKMLLEKRRCENM